MTRRVCPTPGCPTLTNGGPCARHRAEQRRQRGSTGYGRPARRRKAQLLPTAIGRPCPTCGTTITADNADLDHTTPRAITGTDQPGDRIRCATCNRRDGGRLSAALRAGRDV